MDGENLFEHTCNVISERGVSPSQSQMPTLHIQPIALLNEYIAEETCLSNWN